MATSSEISVNNLIDEVLDVVCVNQEDISCPVEKESLLETITSEDTSKDAEVIVTAFVSCAIDSRIPEDQLLEDAGKIDNIVGHPGDCSVNSGVEVVHSSLSCFKNDDKSKSEVLSVDTGNRNNPDKALDHEDQNCGKSSESDYTETCFSSGNDQKEQLPIASCSRKDAGDFPTEELMVKTGKSEDVDTPDSILLESNPYVFSAEVQSIESVVASNLEGLKEQLSWPPVYQSMTNIQYEPFSHSGANYYESSFCVAKLNNIFHSWNMSNLESPENHMIFTSSTPKQMPTSFVNALQQTQDSAIPEEYSRNLPEFYRETLAAMKTDATTPIFNQSSGASTPKPQYGFKTSKNTYREKKKNKAKLKKKKSETSEHGSFSMYEKHTNDIRDPIVDLEYMSCSNENSDRSQSVVGNVCREVKSPQPGCSMHQIAANIEEVFQTLSVQGFNDSPTTNPNASKGNRSRRKTKYITLKRENVSPELSIGNSEVSKNIASQPVKSDVNQSPTTTGKRNKNNTINTVVQNGTPNSSPAQKGESKSPKKKVKKEFEKYWSLDAVKEGIRNGTVIESVVRINPKNYTEAYATSPDGGQDIFVEGVIDRNRALEGDLVAILLKDPSEWKHEKGKRKRTKSKVDYCSESQDVNESVLDVTDNSIQECSTDLKGSQITGKVIRILSEQHSRKCVGYLKLMKDNNQKYALFSPRDNRIPRLHIPFERCPKDFWQDPASKKDIIYLAKIKKWIHGMFALGEVLEVVGETANPEAETTALLMDNDLDVSPYPEVFSKMFPSHPEVISEEELAKRADFRKECIFTIDPITAKDLDDAVSCKELENGNLEIGVHISDVTYFLAEGTLLDEEVCKRATSVYLVDKVYHMLPTELCLQCSLLPGQDRLAYSVIWEITKEAKIVSQRITRSIIKSCVKLAYEHAQAMLENPDKEWDADDFPPISNGFSVSQISKVVNLLQSIAVQLRNQRFEGGALRIDQTKVYIKLDEKGIPFSVEECVSKDSNRLIEEFMLLANMTTAKFIYDKYPDIAFLRCHPDPHKYPLEVLQETLSSRGIHVNIKSAGALQTSLARYSGDDFLSKSRCIVLNVLCAKTMARAKYFCSNEQNEGDFWHYALSVPFYTHFTSPIRRYADVMVHRLLNAALGYNTKPTWSTNHVSSVAANCNKKKYSAKMAGEHSVKLFLSLYIRFHQPVLEEAVVIDVKDHSFDINVCKFGLNMRVYVTKMNVELDYDSNEKVSAMKIKWDPKEDCPMPTIQIIELFTIVSVKITCEDKSLKLISTLLQPPNLPLVTDNSVTEEN